MSYPPGLVELRGPATCCLPIQLVRISGILLLLTAGRERGPL